MKHKYFVGILIGLCMLLSIGCGVKDTAAVTESGAVIAEDTESIEEQEKTLLEDGIYEAEFHTDSSMFHVNEAYENKGILTVENGEMTIHITLAGKGILNLYPGLAEDAAKEGAVLLEPTLDQVTYSDGWVDEAYGFDVPVPYLEEEFDLALIGTKQNWYDHKVYVSNPVLQEEENASESGTGSDAEAAGDAMESANEAAGGADVAEEAENADSTAATEEAENAAGVLYAEDIEEGGCLVEVELRGGSGRASLESPTSLSVADGVMTVTLIWSSPNYDYMIVDGVKYFPINAGGNSVFQIPVTAINTEIPIIADTVAMSEPHEIEYVLYISR